MCNSWTSATRNPQPQKSAWQGFAVETEYHKDGSPEIMLILLASHAEGN
jgi:hypothetical protein